MEIAILILAFLLLLASSAGIGAFLWAADVGIAGASPASSQPLSQAETNTHEDRHDMPVAA
jgi:hypothetical protein